MLVVTRKQGQKIMIGDDIEVLIVEGHGQIKVGVKAPKEIAVHREEVYERIKAEGPR